MPKRRDLGLEGDVEVSEFERLREQVFSSVEIPNLLTATEQCLAIVTYGSHLETHQIMSSRLKEFSHSDLHNAHGPRERPFDQPSQSPFVTI